MFTLHNNLTFSFQHRLNTTLPSRHPHAYSCDLPGQFSIYPSGADLTLVSQSRFTMGSQGGFGCEIYSVLYDHIFESAQFEYWQSKQCSWQLRVFGGPGSGKASLSFSRKRGSLSYTHHLLTRLIPLFEDLF